MVEDGAGRHLGGTSRRLVPPLALGGGRKWTAEGLDHPEVHSLTVDEGGRLWRGRATPSSDWPIEESPALRCRSTGGSHRDEPAADLSLDSGGSLGAPTGCTACEGTSVAARRRCRLRLPGGSGCSTTVPATCGWAQAGRGCGACRERADGGLFVEQSTVRPPASLVTGSCRCSRIATATSGRAHSTA